MIYTDKDSIRTFCIDDTENEDYVWHRDLENREITVLEGKNWQFQEEDALPRFINIGDSFKINKLIWHRIIPGSSSLKIHIKEF